MRSDHRHELKTNELADWIAHLPEWARENRTTLVAAGAVALVALLVYFWSFYRKDAVSTRSQERLTTLVTRELPEKISLIARASGQDNLNSGQSYILLPVAQNLQEFAQKSSDNDMAALALIERAVALRAELHYRLTEVPRDELATQIGLAKDSYQQALDRHPSSATLTALAQYGVGLCEEELGDFDQAAEIYRELTQKPEYAGTTSEAAAAYRLEIMNDYRSPVVFPPVPPKPAETPAPAPQVQPGAATNPTAVPAPAEPMVGPVAPGDANAGATPAPAPAPAAQPSASVSAPAPAATPEKSDTNTPKGS